MMARVRSVTVCLQARNSELGISRSQTVDVRCWKQIIVTTLARTVDNQDHYTESDSAHSNIIM